MDIRRLGYFTRVAELGSINATAEEVNLSQPSLSRQIRLLEEELGVRLFTRQRNGMELTRQGLELRLRIAGPLRQLELGLLDIKSQASSAGGTVIVGMPSSVIYVLASPLVRRVKTFAPNLSLHITEGIAGNLLEAVENGEIDIALLNGPLGKCHCATEDLLVDQMMLIGPPDSALSPDVPVGIEELQKLPMVFARPQAHPSSIRPILEKYTDGADAPITVPIYADSFLLIKSYVEAGIGYAILPYSAFSREAENGQLKYAPISDIDVKRHLVLGIHQGGQSPRAVQTVRKLIFDEILSLNRSGKWDAELLFDLGEVQP